MDTNTEDIIDDLKGLIDYLESEPAECWFESNIEDWRRRLDRASGFLIEMAVADEDEGENE